MEREWTTVTAKRKNEWLNLASEIILGTVFEYYPDEDYMIYAKYEQKNYKYEKQINNYLTEIKEWIHPEDISELYRFTEQIRRESPRVYAELRMCFESTHKHVYQLSAIQGYRVFDEEKKVHKIIGQMYPMESQWKERKLYYETKRDTITYLWNHKYVKEYIQDYLGHGGTNGILFIVDVDNFRKINESMGRLFGDHVILSVSKVLRSTFRSSDIIGRLGGDEFLMFMRGKSSDILIRQKCEEICSAVGTIYCGDKSKVSASIGVSVFPKDGMTYDELFGKADKALHYAKGSSIGYAVYDEDIEDIIVTERESKVHVEKNADKNEKAYNAFYHEIAELTFRLMGDTTEVESAVMLLLRKIKDYFDFDHINVQEMEREEQRTLRCIYEVREDYLPARLNTSRQYSEAEWMAMLYVLDQGSYVQEKNDSSDLKLISRESELCTALRIPLGNKTLPTGMVDFIYTSKKHKWEEEEVQFLQSFSKILSVYLTRIGTLDEAHFLATMMQERDSTTGLYSYYKFMERMREITSLKSEKTQILYVYSDICHFKFINETYGYEIGNMVLRKSADFLLGLKKHNLLCAARVHSDNIVMAFRNSQNKSEEELSVMVDEYNRQLSEELRQVVHDNMITMRSGLFLNMDKNLTVEEAVSHAAYACKEGKRRNRPESIVFYDGMMNEYKYHLSLLSELPGAIEKRELEVYIQPKMHYDGVTVAGGEALIRWIKPGNHIIYPNDFIPFFEKSGAIKDLDYFVYDEVFAWLRERQENGHPIVPISINVSRVHLNNDNMTEYIRHLLRKYQIAPELVEFELTESTYIDNMEQVGRLVSQLRDLGSKVSMDDFGSGYSSLNMLDKMPIDIMKIDRIFLKEEVLRDNDKIILDCIIQMAKKLDMCVVCEGVETQNQYEFLRDSGCDIMQGFYFGRPMPIEEFNQFLVEKER